MEYTSHASPVGGDVVSVVVDDAVAVGDVVSVMVMMLLIALKDLFLLFTLLVMC
jgi:hypothetical protein